jgi:RNA polymerase sigma-70 factor, ECF subfamily
VISVLQRSFGYALDYHALQDVISESLFLCWQNRRRFDSEKGSIAGWFYTTARNVAIDHVGKTSGRKLESFIDVQHVGEPRKNQDSWELSEALKAAIATLSPREQRIVANEFFKDRYFTSRELAEELGISPSAVRVLQHRAMAKLRKLLQNTEANLSNIKRGFDQ